MLNTRKSAVIIEDDMPIADMIEQKLKLDNFIVYVANNGLEGIEIINKYLPDVILLDLSVPIVDGLGVLRAVRNNPRLEKCKVIILSNSDKEDAPAELKELGVDKYIVKAHCTPKEVLESVKNLIEK